MAVVAYNQDSIKGLSDIEHMRMIPSAYIHDTGRDGQLHVCKELIDNGADELKLLGQGTLDVLMFQNGESYSFIIADTGRGIPYQRIIDVFVNARTSGKFTADAYNGTSAGMFGIGATVTYALSSWFRVISMNEDIIGDATIGHAVANNLINTCPNMYQRTGTIAMYTPDSTIFTGISEFIADHSNLNELLVSLSLFGKYRIRFFEFAQELPKVFKQGSAEQVIEELTRTTETLSPDYDSILLDREGYIYQYFGIQKKWDAVIPLGGRNPEGTLSVTGDIRVLLRGGNLSNNKLTFVNNVLFTDNSSLHIKLLHEFLKGQFAPRVSDKRVKEFFINQYRLPIWLVLNIEFGEAKFTGFQKSSFKDLKFSQPYLKLLSDVFTQETLGNMFDLIKDHIQIEYNRVSNSDLKVGNMKHLLTKLARPEKYSGCSTTNRELAELFLIEGDSAKPNQKRDSVHQASYTIGGKPFNGLTSLSRTAESVNALKQNDIFKDLIKIIGITPGSDDLSNLNFGSIFIMADADTHGYHITNILISNLYLLCPALVTSGKIHVVHPPLYSLNVKGRDPIYLRNTEELNATLAYQLYYRCLDLTIEADGFSRLLNREEFTVFSEMIVKIGDELDRLSKEYMIPAILLEQLSLNTNLLNTRPVNIDMIRANLGYEVKYIESSHLLIISMGMEDVIVPLTQITDLIYQRILPLYRMFYYGKTRILATTKRTSWLANSPVTVVQIYEVFNQLRKVFTIERFKGLGRMPPTDLAKTCTIPETRRVHQITELGDIQRIFDMMGDDPRVRKELIEA